MKTASRAIFWFAIVGLLGACATVPEPRDAVQSALSTSGNALPASQEIDLYYQGEINVEQAVALALSQNVTLQRQINALNAAAAEVAAATRVRNPVLSLARLNSDQPGLGSEITVGLMTSLADLLTLGTRTRLAKAGYSAQVQEAGYAVLQTAAEAQRRHTAAVRANALFRLRQEMEKLELLNLELAERFVDAGNLEPRDFAEYQAAAAEAQLATLKAQSEQLEARRELAAALGIVASAPWQTTENLSVPPADELSDASLIDQAFADRLDLAAAEVRLGARETASGYVTGNVLLGDVEVGAEREREPEGGRLLGPTLDWQVPLFNQGQPERQRRNAAVQEASLAVIGLKRQIADDVYLARNAMNIARAQFETLANALAPALREVTRRTHEQNAFMLTGTFDLIEQKQNELHVYGELIEAAAEFWLARADLERSIGRPLPSPGELTDFSLDTLLDLKEQKKTMRHHHHHQGGAGK